MGATLETSLDLPEEPDVSIGGFPFLLDLGDGRLESVTVRLRELDRTGIKVERLRVVLEDISFSISDAVAGELDRVRVERGHGSATLSGSILEGLLSGISSRGVPVPEISIDDLPGLEVEGTTLVVGPARVELPVLMEEMRYSSARISEGEVILDFRIDRTSLRV